MQIQQIALISEDNGPDASTLSRVAAALQRQVMRDVAPHWSITAAVHAFPFLEDVPLGFWPIVITGDPLGGHAGIHLDENAQPYAHVYASPTWSLDASRVCLDMLINPSEGRIVVGPSPRGHFGEAEYLVEACGPCDPRRGYDINGVLVSDFCTPAFFDLEPALRTGYSIRGSVNAPFQLAKRGHLTWRDPVYTIWWLRSHWSEDPIDTRLGVVDKRVISVREFIQTCSSDFNDPTDEMADRQARATAKAARSRAERLRAESHAPPRPVHAQRESGTHRSVGAAPRVFDLDAPTERYTRGSVRSRQRPPPLPISAVAARPRIHAARSGALFLGSALAGGLVVAVAQTLPSLNVSLDTASAQSPATNTPAVPPVAAVQTRPSTTSAPLARRGPKHATRIAPHESRVAAAVPEQTPIADPFDALIESRQ